MKSVKFIFLVILSILFNNSSLSAICFYIKVPHNFFVMTFPQKNIEIGTDYYQIADKNYGDIRVLHLPKDVLKKYIHQATKTLDVIPESVLQQYSPFTILVEYQRPSGRIVTIQEPIKEAGIIEKCYLSDEKIVEKKGIIESIKSKVGSPEAYHNFTISLRQLTARGETKTNLCGRYDTFDKKGVEIDLKNSEQGGIDAYSCTVTAIK